MTTIKSSTTSLRRQLLKLWAVFLIAVRVFLLNIGGGGGGKSVMKTGSSGRRGILSPLQDGGP